MREPGDELVGAIRRRDTAAALALIERSPARVNRFGDVARDWGAERWLPVHHAAAAGDAQVVGALLDGGASPDARTRFRTPMHARMTPLLLACEAGHEAVARLLLDRGAEREPRDAVARGPLHVAAWGGHAAVVRLLVGRGAMLEAVDEQGRTPLHAAIQGPAEANAAEVVAAALLTAGGDADAVCPREAEGYTPLHRCVTRGLARLGVARRLVEAGADASVRDPRFGLTAGELAQRRAEAGEPGAETLVAALAGR